MGDIDVNSLEPNSHKFKAEKAKGELAQKSKDKISPVVKREQVVSTRKPLSKKFVETFITEDVNDIKIWLIKDVIIPGIQNTVLDMLSMMFFGESNSGRRRSRRNRDDGRTDYSSRYRGSSYGRDDSRRGRNRDDNYESDDKVDFRNIVLRNRDDAEMVISKMRGRIRDDGSASVADLLDLMDVTARYTDNNWGWDDGRDIGIRRVSSGYLIDVAEPKYLD